MAALIGDLPAKGNISLLLGEFPGHCNRNPYSKSLIKCQESQQVWFGDLVHWEKEPKALLANSIRETMGGGQRTPNNF